MAEPRDMQNQSNTGRSGMNAGTESDKSHPVATGVGALGGAAAGAAAGTMAGPVGTVVGAVAGAVVGGLGGSAVGRAFDPAEEDRYWRENYSSEPYVESGRSYDDYGPAYTLGMTGRSTYGGRFEEAEDRLSQEWTRQRGGSSLSWEQAREPSRAAWHRIEERYPMAGDSELTGSSGSTVIGRGEDSSSSADLGTGLSSGRSSTYSTSGSSGSSAYDTGNTVRSTGGLKDLGGAVGSADQSQRSDLARHAEHMSFANRPTSDSSLFSPRTSSATGAVGSVQSASIGEVSDKDDVVDVLNDLIECCRDGEYGFNLCAEHAQNSELRSRLSQHAEECRSAARELMDCIRRLGGEVDDGGSMMGSMHRGWVSIKGTLAGYSDRAMLSEAERGEDAALARYHKALDEKLPSDVRSLVQRQAEGVKRNHDEMKLWRDRLQDRG